MSTSKDQPSYGKAISDRRKSLGKTQLMVEEETDGQIYQKLVYRLEHGLVHPLDLDVPKFKALLFVLQWDVTDFEFETGIVINDKESSSRDEIQLGKLNSIPKKLGFSEITVNNIEKSYNNMMKVPLLIPSSISRIIDPEDACRLEVESSLYVSPQLVSEFSTMYEAWFDAFIEPYNGASVIVQDQQGRYSVVVWGSNYNVVSLDGLNLKQLKNIIPIAVHRVSMSLKDLPS